MMALMACSKRGFRPKGAALRSMQHSSTAKRLKTQKAAKQLGPSSPFLGELWLGPRGPLDNPYTTPLPNPFKEFRL